MTEYFTDIEAHFAQRRGTPFVLSAKDWALMAHEATHVATRAVTQLTDYPGDALANDSFPSWQASSRNSYCASLFRTIANASVQGRVYTSGSVTVA